MKQIQYYGNKNIISKRLKELRLKNKLSQNELAAKLQLMNLNIDQQIISRIEHNQRIVTDYELVCISKVLNADVNYFLQDFDEYSE